MGPLESSVAISLGTGDFSNIPNYPTSHEDCSPTISEREMSKSTKAIHLVEILSASFTGSF